MPSAPHVAAVLLLVGVSLVDSARAQPPAPPAPIASAEGQTPGLRVELHQLKRSGGGTVTITFTVINDAERDFGNSCAFRAGSEPCGHVTGVYLIDAANKKKYGVLRDSEGQCVCAPVDKIPARTRVNLWAKLPAPPEAVKTVGVVIPQFLPMDDVAIGP